MVVIAAGWLRGARVGAVAVSGDGATCGGASAAIALGAGENPAQAIAQKLKHWTANFCIKPIGREPEERAGMLRDGSAVSSKHNLI